MLIKIIFKSNLNLKVKVNLKSQAMKTIAFKTLLASAMAVAVKKTEDLPDLPWEGVTVGDIFNGLVEAHGDADGIA